MPSAWLAVACAKHVRRAKVDGIIQVSHGKAAPLRRIRPGDGIVYYSPTIQLGERTPYRHLTAIGTVADGEPYRFDMVDGFRPWRCNVVWMNSTEIPITPLLPSLSFSSGRKNWGLALRRGLVRIEERDFMLIREAMRVNGSPG
ncbi:EVE domain-containing protein [Lipomyces doorenjongii]